MVSRTHKCNPGPDIQLSCQRFPWFPRGAISNEHKLDFWPGSKDLLRGAKKNLTAFLRYEPSDETDQNGALGADFFPQRRRRQVESFDIDAVGNRGHFVRRHA